MDALQLVSGYVVCMTNMLSLLMLLVSFDAAILAGHAKEVNDA